MQGLIADVLAAWRAAERVAEEHPSGPVHEVAVVAALQLRELYHELMENPAADDPERIRDTFERIRQSVPGSGSEA